MVKSTKTNTIAQRLAEIEADSAAEDAALWGEATGARSQPQNSLVNSPKFHQVVAILHENPILVAPALKWLVEKRAALSLAQLQALYTPEELDELVKQSQQGK